MSLRARWQRLVGRKRKPEPTPAQATPAEAPPVKERRPVPTPAREASPKAPPAEEQRAEVKPAPETAPEAPPAEGPMSEAPPAQATPAEAVQAEEQKPKAVSALEAPAEGLQGASVPAGGTMVMSAIPTMQTAPQMPTFTARLVVAWSGESGGEGSGDVETGTTFELKGDRVTIGRSPDNGIHVDHPSVSSAHAVIRKKDGRYHLFDLGSTNGTWVNDDAVKGTMLGEGSGISVGASSLFFTQIGSGSVQRRTMGLGSRGVIMVRSGPSVGRRFPVGEEDMVIGRQPGERGAQIDDPEADPCHALVRPTPEGCLLYDLGSSRGTKLNDVDLMGSLLSNGDMIKLGLAELRFVEDDAD